MYRAMSDLASHLSPEELAELGALADGTLPAQRRAEVEARVAASPQLQELVERQRQAVLAARALEAELPPASLQAAVAARRRQLGSRRSRRLPVAPRFALAGALAVAAAVVAAVLLTGGPGAPTVADAARLAGEPPTGPAPLPAGNAGTTLALAVQGLSFPDLARAYGWRPLGVRHGRVDGRDATVVYYGKGDRRIAYVIVAGAGLPRPSAGQGVVKDGVEYRTLRLNGRLAVTWRRGGHTCVLLGDAARAELVTLASWPLSSSR
jgi:anti-sigma factor RsiW